jgi:hypothetical protein
VKPLLPTPATPPLSPLAEVVLAFADSDPDACALLQPFADGLSQDDLEVRARRQFPHLPSSDRLMLVHRALELLELAQQGGGAPAAPALERGTTPRVSPEQRAATRGVLESALKEEPALTAERGKALLREHLGMDIPTGTFYGTYWKPVIDRLPPSVREQRQQMTARRPSTTKLSVTDRQKAEVRKLVAVLKRDHPDWHSGQMMDDVRRETGIPFSDPTSFKRYYVDPVTPAPARSEKKRPARASAPVHRPPTSRPTSDAAQPQPVAAELPPVAADPIRRPDGGLTPLLASADPLHPAQLTDAPDGRMQVQLNFRAMERGEAYRMMSLVYTELARHAEAAGNRSDPMEYEIH